jgi:excisionase family DNA binding protein
MAEMKRASKKSLKGRGKREDAEIVPDEGVLLAETLKSALSEDAAALLPVRKTKAAAVPITDKQMLALREASALSGYSNEFLLEAIRSGHLTAEKISGKWNVKRDDLQKWLKHL